jgi:hypothetical protein
MFRSKSIPSGPSSDDFSHLLFQEKTNATEEIIKKALSAGKSIQLQADLV